VRGLSEDERVEYQEIGNSVRQDDLVHLAISSITIPVLFGAVSYAWQQPTVMYPLFLGSLIVWLYWWVVRGRRYGFAKLRYERAWALEEDAGMWHHRKIREADERRSYFRRMVSIKRFEGFASIVLLVTWIGLIAYPILAVCALFVLDFVVAYLLTELNRNRAVG